MVRFTISSKTSAQIARQHYKINSFIDIWINFTYYNSIWITWIIDYPRAQCMRINIKLSRVTRINVIIRFYSPKEGCINKVSNDYT